jgi:hypothetical protein
MKLIEGELEFDFGRSGSCFRLDEQGVPLPVGMSFVDFVVEDGDRYLLVEVKDPSDRSLSEDERRDYANRLRGEELIHQKLTPKARDSYTYLHLMRMDSKPFVFVVVLGLEKLPIEPPLLIGFQDRLTARLRKEGQSPWKHEYIQGCVVVDVGAWNRQFKHFPLVRSN